MSDKLTVNEIFDSIEGEGKRQGQLATFIRLTGCNLRCSYCDTAYAFDEGKEMAVEEILGEIHFPNVTLTGGEPLKQDIRGLLARIPAYVAVNIETNGSYDLGPCIDLGTGNLFFTMDYKCGSAGTGAGETALLNIRERLRAQDVLKFVVGNRQDLDEARAVCYDYTPECQVYVSPVYGKIAPVEIVEYMKQNYLTDWRLQLQIHKLVWSPDKRGV